MAITIPKYDQQVDIRTPIVQAPQPANAVRGAFGEEVAAANTRLGETGSKIAGIMARHMVEKKKQADDAFAAELETNYLKTSQDKLINPNLEKVNINGQDVERPSGMLNRPLGLAAGATNEYAEWYVGEKQRILSSVPDGPNAEEIRANLGQSIDRHYLRTRENVISHEAKQGRLTLIGSYVSNLEQQKIDAAGISDPESLKFSITKSLETQQRIDAVNQTDPVTAKKNEKNLASDIATTAATSVLISTGDLVKAQALIESVKNDLDPERYLNITESLDKKAAALKSQAGKDIKDFQNKKENEATVKIGQGKYTLNDWQADVDAGVFDSPKKMVEFKEYAINGINIEAKDDESTYTKLMDTFYSLGQVNDKGKITKSPATGEEIAKFRLEVIQANKKGLLSDVESNKFINATEKLFDDKAQQEFRKNHHWWPSLKEVLAGSLEKKREWMSRVGINGEQPGMVSAEMKQRTAAEKHPDISNLKPGDSWTNPKGVQFEFMGLNQAGKPIVKRKK